MNTNLVAGSFLIIIIILIIRGIGQVSEIEDLTRDREV